MHSFKYFLFVFLLLAVYPSFAQEDVSAVQVDNLTDEQIQKIMDEINARGLSMDQAIQMARMRGATQQQIDQFKMRMQEKTLQGNTGTDQAVRPDLSADPLQSGNPVVKEPLSQKNTGTANEEDKEANEEEKISDKNKRIFGYHLFNGKNLSFEPSVNIPVPSDYVLGIGDVVVIQVWGASQQTYNLRVDGNGAVNIPGIGPVAIAHLNFSTARDRIVSRLGSIYDGMNGANPNTWADVAINNPRAIKVNVIGEAITPGTYTVPATASAFNVLYLSGGPNETGSFRDIRIMRDNKLLATIDVYEYLIHGNTQHNRALRDQDIIFIPTYKKRVETTGTFKRNGIFELKEGENLEQLLDYNGGFSEDASSSRVLLTRYMNDQYQLNDIARENFSSFQLKNGDLIRAERIIERYENRLTIEGAVFRPGSYALESGMTLSQLIKKAGGLREDYFANRGLMIRLDDQLYPTTIPFDLDEVMQGKNDPLLQREDQIVIQDIFGMGEKKNVRIFGEVMKPGEFEFRKNMTLKDLVFLAGGMTEAASESYIEVARRNSYEEAGAINSKLASLYQFSIGRDLKLTGQDAGFLLQPFDQVYVRRAPSYQVQQTVYIRGEVKYPGEYSISDKNERISDLIKRAGGITPTAFTEGAKLRRQLDEQTQEQLEVVRELEANLQTTIHLDTTATVANLELRLSRILSEPHTPYDYLLKAGDEIIIPVKTEEVWVNGEILSPMGLAWEQGKGIRYYIDRSGGFSGDAKKGKVYVVNSNGTTEVTKRFIFRHYPTVTPGSRIIVPARPEKKLSDSGKWIALTTALSSLAIAFAAVFK